MLRRLTEKGVFEAKSLGERLRIKQIFPDLIVCSPATRTRLTAMLVAKAVDYPILEIKEAASLYGATPRTYLEVVNSTDDAVKILAVVGHNPVTSAMPAYLTQRPFDVMPTAGCVALEIKTERWAYVSLGTATFKWQFRPPPFIRPDPYKIG
ncbi:MAG: histidine phosphatase family protein [Bacteroidia bacterium]|nr:histidine phosphatase family protein [Bacteroidia bacterium]MDW8333086.1 histidine phosphatase family protein [Bacteroidia bacterium]